MYSIKCLYRPTLYSVTYINMEYGTFPPKYWLLLYIYLLHLTWAVVEKSVLGDLMEWFVQFGPKLLCVSCLKWARDRMCWIPVLATKGEVPTGSLYEKKTRQIGRQTTDIAHIMSGVSLVPMDTGEVERRHETGSCDSYISSNFCDLRKIFQTRSLFSLSPQKINIPEIYLFVKG